MAFTPHSTQSLAHRNLILQLSKRHQKVSKTKQYVVLEDPEKLAREAEKVFQLIDFNNFFQAEQERLKARRKLEQKRQEEMLREGGFRYEDTYSSRASRPQGQLDEYAMDDGFGIFISFIM